MNDSINKFLAAGDEIHLRQPRFTYSACGSFVKNKKKTKKNLKKQEIEEIFIRTNQVKSASSMIWLMDVLRIFLEEQFLIKY